MDCPDPTRVNRWYRDGYMARLNGKMLSTNPKGYQSWSAKAARWSHGWQDADTAIHQRIDWDREQDIIDELAREMS